MKKTYVLIDCEYVYTCARREGKIPNYKGIIDIIKYYHKNSVLCAYFMGQKKKKKAVSDYLIRAGIDFVSIIEMDFCSKTQILGSTFAIDVVKAALTEDIEQFVFLTGDDYMVPIVEFLNKYEYKPIIYYFPLILSRYLRGPDCSLFRLREGCFIFKDRPDEYNRIYKTISAEDKKESDTVQSN